MRVLMIVPTFRPNIGGVESYVDDLCSFLVRRGNAVSVLTYQPLTTRARGPAYEKEGGLEIRRISWFGMNLFHALEPYPALEFLYITPYLFLHAFFFMLRHGRSIDVIHAQGLNAAFIARALSAWFGKRAVASTCAVYGFRPRSLFARAARRILAGFARVLALGPVSAKELEAIGVPREKIRLYNLWVDQRAYAPLDKATAKARIGCPQAFLVLFVGRFIPIKGVDVLMEAARRADTGIVFYFIGDSGPLLEHVRRAAAQHGNIRLIEGVRGRDLIPYYQAADLQVVPSLYEEAFGKVIIEALSCGTPVIGARRGAIPGIIDPGVGRVVEPTADNIIEAIEDLRRRPEALAGLTGRCRGHAVEHYGEKNAETIAEAYAS
ncbi:MAG: glycosyltransferase family 4 protein [Deltaproteobacteria bacterium]